MIVVVPVDPPADGLLPNSLLEETPLSRTDVRRLYEASVADVVRAVDASGGELLVNYRDEETLPDGVSEAADGPEPEAAVRSLVEAALESVEDVRFERQVGSTRAARVGNTVTHLLEREEHASVGVLEPTASPIGRTQIDGAAMTSRSAEVVLGPTTGGEVYMACFTEPIDFTDAYAPPALTTLAGLAGEADFDVGFAPMLPTIDTPAGLCEVISLLEARRIAGHPGGETVAAVVEELGLEVGPGPMIARKETDNAF